MQTELGTLKGLWNKAATPSAKARLLAGFSEAVRRELHRQTGDASLLDGLTYGNRDVDRKDATSSTEVVSGALQLYLLGQIEVKTFEQRVARARRKAAKKERKQAVKRLANEWSLRQSLTCMP